MMSKTKINDGFTLIEIIVSMTLLSIFSVSMVLFFGHLFDAFNKKTIETDLMLEMQNIKVNLNDTIREAIYYEYFDQILEVNLAIGLDEFWYYYYFDLDDNIVYLKRFTVKQDKNTIKDSFKSFDFLARYVTNFNITPNEFDTTKMDIASNSMDCSVNYSISVSYREMSFSIENTITLRNGH